MANEKKIDPFKPAQPQIPGVPPAVEKAKPSAPEPPSQAGTLEETAAPKSVPWPAVAAGVALLTVGGLVYWARGSFSKPGPAAREAGEASPSLPAAAEPTRRAEKLAVGPGPIATTDELAKAWSAKRFLFRGPASSELVSAIVVRLPGGAYWGLSLREPFGNCELEYVTDMQKLKANYNFASDHPMVGNPCTRAVYDLTRYGGGAPNGGLVRGDIVSGAGVRPPLAIEIRVEGKQVRAVRME